MTAKKNTSAKKVKPFSIDPIEKSVIVQGYTDTFREIFPPELCSAISGDHNSYLGEAFGFIQRAETEIEMEQAVWFISDFFERFYHDFLEDKFAEFEKLDVASAIIALTKFKIHYGGKLDLIDLNNRIVNPETKQGLKENFAQIIGMIDKRLQWYESLKPLLNSQALNLPVRDIPVMQTTQLKPIGWISQKSLTDLIYVLREMSVYGLIQSPDLAGAIYDHFEWDGKKPMKKKQVKSIRTIISQLSGQHPQKKPSTKAKALIQDITANVKSRKQ